MKLSGWGGFPQKNCCISSPRDEVQLKAQVLQQSAIARGNGRAYGDSAISTENTILMQHFNHFIDFNPDDGLLTVEGGVLLHDIITALLPQGWFVPVTPGTQYVTIGGMIAADVHGKNHHKHGSFRQFVKWIDLMDDKGEIKRCSANENSEMFEWTIGGMGLTGIILRASIEMIRVESGWIKQTTLVANNLIDAIDLFEKNLEATYSVAWIDCHAKGEQMGRSLVMLGEHAELTDLPPSKRHTPYQTPTKRKLAIPFNLPNFALNSLTMKWFNQLYFYLGQRNNENDESNLDKSSLVDWDSYFYPLDGLLHWNRIYGSRGFLQYQCVIPLMQAETGITHLLNAISDSGEASFLAVLKRFGAQSGRSGISFPMEGYTLALDFPVKEKTLALMKQLDSIVLDYGGRFYLAKDSRMSGETLHQSDQRLEPFAEFRQTKQKTYQSSQSQRLGI